MENYQDLLEWKVRRTKTFIAFICEAVALGMEYSLTFITLWLYLEKINASHPKMFYSLISAAYLLSQIVASIVLGRIADKLRNLEQMFFVGNLLVVVGNILYTIPSSPWMLFGGRLLSGGGGCLRCIMTGEIARSYPETEVNSKFSLMGMAFGLGFIVGPGINFAFLKADFWIGFIHIEYVNAPGFYLAVFFILTQLLAFALVSNLSKEFDLKETSIELGMLPSADTFHTSESKQDEKTSLLIKKDASSANRDVASSEWNVFKKMFENIDTCLILLFSFFFMYCMVSFDLWQPLAVLTLNKWGVFEINLIVFGYGILTVIVLLLLTFFPVSDKVIVYLSMVCMFSLSAVNIIFLIFAQVPSEKILNVVLWILFDVFFAVIVIMEEVFLIGVMAKMTVSAQQSFAESVRLSFSRIGALIGLLAASVTFQHLTLTCAILASLGMFGIFLICLRRRSLQYPKVIIK